MFLILFISLFGLCVGSFLNVVIYRTKIKKSLLHPPSFCPFCKHRLAWYDLIPVASFIILGGKCRYCRKKVSWQYPLVELACGILFALFYIKVGSINPLLFFNLFFVSIFVVIFVYDLKYYLILDKIILLGATLAILATIFLGKPSFPAALLGSLLSGGFFAIIVLVSKGKWMGGGDVKLGFLLGFILGWSQVLVALFIAFVLGSMVGLLLIALQKKTLKSAVPFGTFLTVAAIATMLEGERILKWYLNLIT